MSATPKDIAAELRRLSRKCEGWCNDPRAMMVQAAAVIEQMSEGLAQMTRERDAAYERGLAEGRIDLEKIVRKWDSECLDPPEVEGLRDYAMLDGERLETLWKAFELAMAREMQMTRERDEARSAFASFDALFRGVRQLRDEAMKERDEAAKERDALRAELEALQPGIDHLRETCDALERERDEARALNAAWEEKAATWMASPEFAQRLQGYRDMGQQVAQAQNERDALRAEVGGLRHALSRALVEMRHANDVMLREAGVGVIDINTILLAKAALLEPVQEPTP